MFPNSIDNFFVKHYLFFVHENEKATLEMTAVGKESAEVDFNQAYALPKRRVQTALTLVLCLEACAVCSLQQACHSSSVLSLPLAEVELLDCEAKSDSSLEREPAEDFSKGADGGKKRKRKPYRPGRAPDLRRQLL